VDPFGYSIAKAVIVDCSESMEKPKIKLTFHSLDKSLQIKFQADSMD